MPRQKLGDRVTGPYLEPDGRWRIVIFREGARTSDHAATKEDAERLAAAYTAELTQSTSRLVTVGAALRDYEEFLRTDKGNLVRSWTTTMYRLRRFFPSDSEQLIQIGKARADELYERFRKLPVLDGRGRPTNRLPSVTFHRNTLVQVRSFVRWCVSRGWCRMNAFQLIEGIGRRNRRKPQVRIDEARRWTDVAIGIASRDAKPGDLEGAVAAMATLYLTLRCSEVIGVQVRDIDDRGRILWVADSKTPTGRRANEIPVFLRPLFERLCRGKRPADLVFGKHLRDWPRKWVQRICRLALVPVVSAHGMRASHTSLNLEAGQTALSLAVAMGHADVRTTLQDYATPDAAAIGAQRRLVDVIRGPQDPAN